jgi:hypothetical protein
VETSTHKPDIYPIFVASFVLLLVFSIHGVTWVPFYDYIGLDLQNLFVFHTQCPGWPIPYEKTGLACGDPLNRGMIYPPLAYWSMAWVRLFDFRTAVLIWGTLIGAMTFFGVWLAARTEPKIRNWLWPVGLLLFAQMPFVYAVERGNLDALVIPIFMIGAVYFSRGKGFLAGFFFATACWMKVYPVVPSLLILATLWALKNLRNEQFWPLFRGFLVGGVVWGILLLPDSYRYLFDVLPGLAAERGGFGTSSHTLYRGGASLFLKIPLLVGWGYLLSRLLKRDPVFALSAALAISTFFQNLSNDYNLITAYPFLFLVMNRLLRRGMTGLDFSVLCLTFLAFVGDRTPMETLFENRGALLTQIVWFIAFPLYVLKRIDKGNWGEGNTTLR